MFRWYIPCRLITVRTAYKTYSIDRSSRDTLSQEDTESQSSQVLDFPRVVKMSCSERCPGSTLDMSEKMFIFPQKTTTAHVRLTPKQDNFTAVTVCHRSFTDLKRRTGHGLFSLATPDKANGFLTWATYNDLSLATHVQNNKVIFDGVDYSPNKWHSICTTWDSATGLTQMWLDGQPLTIKYTTETPLTGKPIVTLGQDQDKYGGGFVANDSFVGMMTDVHMWDYVLSPCEIQKFMKGQSFTPGNIMNWAALDCEVKGNVVIGAKQTGCTCFN